MNQIWAGYSILLSNRSKKITKSRNHKVNLADDINTNIDFLLRSKIWLAQSTRIRDTRFHRIIYEKHFVGKRNIM